MLAQVRSALVMLLLMTVLTGLLYPLAITGVTQLLWPQAAHGSLVQREGATVGSSLIGQSFAGPGYFHSRPSAAGNGYDATSSSGSNLGPTSRPLLDAIHKRVEAARADGDKGAVPVDLVTASGSGLDPHLSPDAARWQVERVAHARSVVPAAIRQLVEEHIEGRNLGFLGAPRVNVLLLNLALDQKFPRPVR